MASRRIDLLRPYGWVPTLLFGAAFMVMAWRLDVGELSNPGPGLWPFIASTVITVTSVVLLLTEQHTGDYESLTPATYRALMGLASLAAFALLLERLGFLLVTPLMFAFWLRVLGRESWLMTVLVTVGASAALYVIFLVVLGAPMPQGILG